VSYEVRFTPAAQAEVDEAEEWYEQRLAGLGGHFIDALEKTVERLRFDALRFPIVRKGVRRILLTRFPYGLYYRVESEPESVVVIACMHNRRSPRRWQRR
jgi:plasmid stabilization system protein ParE